MTPRSGRTLPTPIAVGLAATILVGCVDTGNSEGSVEMAVQRLAESTEASDDSVSKALLFEKTYRLDRSGREVFRETVELTDSGSPVLVELVRGQRYVRTSLRVDGTLVIKEHDFHREQSPGRGFRAAVEFEPSRDQLALELNLFGAKCKGGTVTVRVFGMRCAPGHELQADGRTCGHFAWDRAEAVVPVTTDGWALASDDAGRMQIVWEAANCGLYGKLYADGEWSEDFTVANRSVCPRGYYGVVHRVAMNPQGDSVVVWSGARLKPDYPPDRVDPPLSAYLFEPWAARYSVQTPLTEVPVAEVIGDASASVVRLAAGMNHAGVALALWDADLDRIGNYAVVSAAPDGGWEHRTAISAQGSDAQVHRDAMDRFLAVITGSQLFSRLFTPGVGWDPPVELSGPAFATSSLSPSGRHGMVVWSSDYTADAGYGAVRARSYADGVWDAESAPIFTTEGADTLDGSLSIAINDTGDAALAFVSGGSVRVSRRRDGVFAGPVELAAHAEGADTAPQVALDDDGNVYLLWVRELAGHDEVWASYLPAGDDETWVEPSRISPAGLGSVSQARVVRFGPNRIAALWRQTDADGSNIWFTRIR